MNDSYVELLVKRERQMVFKIMQMICVIVDVFFVLAVVLTGSLLAFVIAVAIGGLAWWLGQKVDIEYEYLCVNRSLTIERISNQSRRKKVEEFDVSRFEVLAPFGSSHLAAFQNRNDVQTKDYSSRQGEERYVLVLAENGKRIMVVLEMNEDLFAQFQKIAPRQVFKD